MNTLLKKSLLSTAIGCAIVLPLAASAATPAAPTPSGVSHSDRAHLPAMSQEKEALEAALKPGKPAETYQRMLTDMGYRITAVNDMKADYLEYEIVKGDNSYEVQIDVDKAKGLAEKIDVTANLWRADATKAALRGEQVKMAKTDAYSDRAYMPKWSDERDALTKQLEKGHEKAYYPERLKALGYQVTAVNESDSDHVEYEVVKGTHSFEVQVNFADASKLAKDVDVGVNLWKADATERALKAHS